MAKKTIHITDFRLDDEWYDEELKEEFSDELAYIKHEHWVIVGEAQDALEWLGIKVDWDTETITYDPYKLEEAHQIVYEAWEFLEEGGDEDEVVQLSPQARKYYFDMLEPYGDDTAFDYHGTYVLAILEAMIRREKEEK